MRSRATRVAIAVLALVAIGSAAAFLYNSERTITASTVALRAFDLHAREATDALADLRASQQAYVASGQGVAFWMPKVASTIDSVTSAIRALRQSAVSSQARADLDQAAATVTEFGEVDSRARDYLKSEQPLMAGDVIFTEGAADAANAARQVESARLAEHQAFDQNSSQVRKQQAIALAAAGGFGVLALLLLVPLPSSMVHEDVTLAPAEGLEEESTARLVPNLPKAALAPKLPDVPEVLEAPKGPSPAWLSAGAVMKAAANLTTDLGRVRDFTDLDRLIGRVADLMDAQGVVVWYGNTSGADLRAAIGHGYPPQVLARMPAVPRSADNAAAAAYRTGTLQIVLSRPGGSSGAIVAPLLTADGCVGALSAEIRHGSEASDTVQALATMFAAQLANVISMPAEAAAPQSKTASA